MTQEEKARAYDEAKYIMEEYLKSGNAGVIAENTIKKAFPELKESDDDRIRKAAISFLEYYEMLEEADHNSTEGIKECISWLEKQKQPVEWSGEDKRMMDIIISDINYAQKNSSDSKLTDYNKKIGWLKSLKPRSIWKPSEMQIASLEVLVEYAATNQYLFLAFPVLHKLCSDLKTL